MKTEKRECPHCHESLERYEDPAAVEIIGRLESELADNERWMREVLTDFRIPFDDHKIGRRMAFTQWMFERQSSNSEIRHGGPETPELKPQRNPPLPASNG